MKHRDGDGSLSMLVAAETVSATGELPLYMRSGALDESLEDNPQSSVRFVLRAYDDAVDYVPRRRLAPRPW